MSIHGQRSRLVVAMCVAASTGAACDAWTHAGSAATSGCVASVQAALGREILDGRVKLRADSGDWATLDDATRLNVLSKLASHASLDCGPADRTGPPNDSWGSPIVVSTRRVAGGIEFKTWSAGPDKRPGTQDDIIVAEGGTIRTE